ncbi:MAG: methylated-DNA--[protein]-cysteine S-methyltransferase [Burkholderiaceae bacterium]
MHYCDIDTPLGAMRLASEDGALCGAWFHGQKYFPSQAGEAVAAARIDTVPVLAQTRRWLDAYFAQRPTGALPPLALQGTTFQRAVWQALLDIAPGEIRTYGLLAAALGRPAAARAVGAAVGRNPVSVLVPCHRVVGAAGQLTGYAGGLARKRRLLALEARAVAAMASRGRPDGQVRNAKPAGRLGISGCPTQPRSVRRTSSISSCWRPSGGPVSCSCASPRPSSVRRR